MKCWKVWQKNNQTNRPHRFAKRLLQPPAADTSEHLECAPFAAISATGRPCKVRVELVEQCKAGGR
jgi:hypothetical protein